MAAPAMRRAPATLRAPARPSPPAPNRARWTYLDAARTHEVVLDWDGARLRVVERAPGAPEAHEDGMPLAASWEVQVQRYQLEKRLLALGSYWRRDELRQDGWRAVALPPGEPTLDLRAPDLPLPAGVVAQHYHDPRQRLDTLLAALPREARYLVLSARFEFPRPEDGVVRVLHAGLPLGPARSLLARDALALTLQGSRPLVMAQDYERAHGAGAAARAAEILGALVARAVAGPAPARAAEPTEDPAWTDLLAILADARLRALQDRFLTPGEADAIVAGGAPAIRRAVAALRARAGHAHQHLVSLLEASLLATARLREGTLRSQDAEVTALRRLAYYL